MSLGEEIIKNTLKNFGLSEKEAEVYIFLGKHVTLKGAEISKYTKINKSETYRILKNLQTKGLIEPTLQSPTRFNVVPFDKIIDSNIKAKLDDAAKIEKAREELLTYWSALGRSPIEALPQKFLVIEGKEKIYSKLSEMIRETKSHFSSISSVTELMKVNQRGLFEVGKTKENVEFRFLTELSQNNFGFMKSFLREMAEAKLKFQARNPELGLRLFPRVIIRDNEEIIFFISSNGSLTKDQENTCIWTNSNDLSQAFALVFEDLWNNAVDIEQKIAEIETKEYVPKSERIHNKEVAQKKYQEIIESAEKEILIITTSEGLMGLWKNLSQLQAWTKKGICVKIMAPITNENLEPAQQISKIIPVRHVVYSYLNTTIIDTKHLFQLENSQTHSENPFADPCFQGVFYTSNPQHVERTKKLVSSVWQTALAPTSDTIKSISSNSNPPIFSPTVVSRFAEKMKKSPPEDLPKGYVTNGIAFIHPPSQFNLPTIAIRIYEYKIGSSFGPGNTLDVRIPLKTSKGFDLVPVAAANTNPNAVVPEKAIFAGSPAAENYLLVKPEELQVRLEGTTLFGGWTFPLSLPPTRHIMPPAAILIEGYGKPRHSKIVWPTPSGYQVIAEFDVYDAFVTFIDPYWKYAGPGTQGQLCIDETMTTIPSQPEK
jgi:sugar-specific transcriptional regulator TrmB